MNLLTDIWTHPANRQARVAAVVRAMKWQAYKRIMRSHIDLPYHGLKLRCQPESHSASRAIYFSGLPDYPEMRFIQDYLKPGDTFIDIGANVGLYTLLALSIVGKTGHVHAFEPNASTAKLFSESIRLNAAQNVTLHQVAVGEQNANVAFESTGDNCTAHVDPDQSPTNVDSEQVEIVRLDDYLPKSEFAMAKLDIEGFEPFALRGAKQLLTAGNPPVLQVEMAGYSKRYGVNTSEFIKELAEVGYFTAVYNPENRTLFETTTPWEIPTENVLAISRQRESFVKERLQSRSI